MRALDVATSGYAEICERNNDWRLKKAFFRHHNDNGWLTLWKKVVFREGNCRGN